MNIAAVGALLTLAVAAGCGDCESRRVEAQFDWRMTANGAEESGLIVGSVGVGNVTDYQGIENAVSNPAGVTGTAAAGP
jgi:hypothetical protein